MKTVVLIVIFHISGGSTIQFQEFTSLASCNHARDTIYDEVKRTKVSGLETAYCVEK